MKYKIALLLVLGCCFSSYSKNSGPDLDRMVARITSTYSKQVAKTDQMTLIPLKNMMMGDINKISLHYDKELNCNISEARALFVEKSKQLLDIINSDNEIRPYLRNHPFTIANLSFSINFVKPDGAEVKYPFVNAVWSYKNEVVYSLFDADGFLVQPDFGEPYEEAVRLVGDAKS